MPLRPSELESHCAQELENLAKLSATALVSSKQHQAAAAAAAAAHHQLGAGGAFRPPGFDPSSPFGPPGPPGHHHKQISPRGGMIEVAPRSRWDVSAKS